jgi:hypothetical protein
MFFSLKFLIVRFLLTIKAANLSIDESCPPFHFKRKDVTTPISYAKNIAQKEERLISRTVLQFISVCLIRIHSGLQRFDNWTSLTFFIYIFETSM